MPTVPAVAILSIGAYPTLSIFGPNWADDGCGFLLVQRRRRADHHLTGSARRAM